MKLLTIFLSALALQAADLYLEPVTVSGEEVFQSIELRDKELSKVVLQESVPGFSQPIIKGLQGDKVSIGLDGVTFSNSIFRSGPNQYFSWIPQGFVSKIEVGEYLENGALGGGINMRLGVNKSQILLDKSSNRYSALGTFSEEDFQAGISIIEAGNIYDTEGEVPHSAYNQKALMMKKQFDEDEMTLLFSRSDEIDRTDLFEVDKYYVYDLQQYAMAKYDKRFEAAVVTLSLQQFKDNVDKNTSYTNTTNNIYGLNLSALYDSEALSGELEYGMQNTLEDVSVVKGPKSQYYYRLNSPWVRYNTYVGKYDISVYYKHSFLDMSGDLSKKMNDFSTGVVLSNEGYYLSVDKSIKFPTIVNLSEAQGDDVSELPNPDLISEKSINYSLGYRSEAFELNLYYKDLQDMIIREQTNILSSDGSYYWQYQNADSGLIYGLSFWAKREYLQDFKTTLFMEYTYGKTDYDYISKLTPFRAEIKNTLFKDYYINFKYAPGVDEDIMANKDKTDVRIEGKNYGYAILDLGYKTQYKNNTFEVGITNALNDQGRAYGSSVDFPKRSLKLQYAYIF